MSATMDAYAEDAEEIALLRQALRQIADMEPEVVFSTSRRMCDIAKTALARQSELEQSANRDGNAPKGRRKSRRNPRQNEPARS